MRTQEHGRFRIFGLDTARFERYRRGVAAGLREDDAGASARFAELVAAAPDYFLFRYHLMSALFAEGRDMEGVAAFRDLQAQDGLAQRFASCDLLLQGALGPLPEQASSPYRVAGTGFHRGVFARDYMDMERVNTGRPPSPVPEDYMAMAKAGAGTRLYEKELAKGGSVVFEGLIRKHTGDDECARVELEAAPVRETLTFNGGLFVLGSNSAVIRRPIQGRFRSFRLVIHRNESRLYVDGDAVVSSAELPPAEADRVRFGLFEAPELLDTSYFLSSLRICHGPRGPASLEELAPAPGMEQYLSNLAVVLTELDEADESLACFANALEGQPSRDIIHNFEEASRTFAERWDPTDPRLRRCLEVVRLQAGEERAAEIRTTIQQRRHEVAVSCRNVSVYFARTPHRIVRPKEIVKRLLNPRRYFETNYFWAVRDVSFDLRYGEVLAIIGDNGAGKSTLLRAIAGMLDYEGSMTIAGKSRLLVMGLGIREELTGRENILLGGLYLGLRKKVVLEKLESILEFAELKESEDVPYKYYSDGMKARLLFSIATSVEPDIVLLDELLGAGDLSFRAKALRKMDELVDHCKAMIVVTHNLSFVREKATKALYIARGRVAYLGDCNKAVDAYLNDSYRRRERAPWKDDAYLLHEL